MKKRNLKTLHLNKKSISSFNSTKTKGGAFSRRNGSCLCSFTCEPTETVAFCETWATCYPFELTDFCEPTP
ncbi:hypothetical protein U8527_15495 [Kordia algicida OT-1]|uniref:Uncharacterized protein n=1 Tax=Kordia algicida OT-1 TaxID=391587 RepID=A9E838_9FLAO|nr:hypothetical protein [Kordia algicida]EDP94962.1 hypothetical protein KAOT1_09114 [Kordia algicida OT-1]